MRSLLPSNDYELSLDRNPKPGLKPRRQIRQPLWGGVNEHGLQVLVETSEDERTDKNEQHAKCYLDGMAAVADLASPSVL
jgi:hypothetical protein